MLLTFNILNYLNSVRSNSLSLKYQAPDIKGIENWSFSWICCWSCCFPGLAGSGAASGLATAAFEYNVSILTKKLFKLNI